MSIPPSAFPPGASAQIIPTPPNQNKRPINSTLIIMFLRKALIGEYLKKLSVNKCVQKKIAMKK
ncbi:MAG: hypothetical protein WCL42_08730 [Chlorobiaceae bacterium]|jgi:hypothetical protein